MKDRTELLAPRARSSGLVVRELNDETLVYDVKREKAHALNRFAGLVWKRCDGETSVADMAEVLQGELDEPVSIDAVWHAIASLADDGLLEEDVAQPVARMSRRAMMQKVGLAASIAVITSIAIPATGALAACPANACGALCSTNNTTCTGLCTSCGGTGNGASCSGSCCASTGATLSTCSGVVCCSPAKTCQTDKHGVNACA
jgi:Coenzyme PQQ synthesis protein D (PqqD)